MKKLSIFNVFLLALTLAGCGNNPPNTRRQDLNNNYKHRRRMPRNVTGAVCPPGTSATMDDNKNFLMQNDAALFAVSKIKVASGQNKQSLDTSALTADDKTLIKGLVDPCSKYFQIHPVLYCLDSTQRLYDVRHLKERCDLAQSVAPSL